MFGRLGAVSRLGLTAIVLFVLAGCPGASSAPLVAQTTTTLDTPQAILNANGSEPSVQMALADIALSTSRSTELRYLALRKLEESHAPRTVAVSETLATSTQSSTDAAFMRNNALGVLWRARSTPDGKSALERAKTTSPEAAAAAHQLERSGS